MEGLSHAAPSVSAPSQESPNGVRVVRARVLFDFSPDARTTASERAMAVRAGDAVDLLAVDGQRRWAYAVLTSRLAAPKAQHGYIPLRFCRLLPQQPPISKTSIEGTTHEVNGVAEFQSDQSARGTKHADGYQTLEARHELLAPTAFEALEQLDARLRTSGPSCSLYTNAISQTAAFSPKAASIPNVLRENSNGLKMLVHSPDLSHRTDTLPDIKNGHKSRVTSYRTRVEQQARRVAKPAAVVRPTVQDPQREPLWVSTIEHNERDRAHERAARGSTQDESSPPLLQEAHHHVVSPEQSAEHNPQHAPLGAPAQTAATAHEGERLWSTHGRGGARRAYASASSSAPPPLDRRADVRGWEQQPNLNPSPNLNRGRRVAVPPPHHAERRWISHSVERSVWTRTDEAPLLPAPACCTPQATPKTQHNSGMLDSRHTHSQTYLHIDPVLI